MLKFKFIHQGIELPPPLFYATELSAGFDVAALLEKTEVIQPGQRAIIPTGLFIDSHEESSVCWTLSNGSSLFARVIPELQLRPRSGLAAKHGITVLNAPATIDVDYRGEIKIILVNHGQEAFIVNSGDRIAQGVVSTVVQLPSVEVKSAKRGTGGFGSTGV